MEKTLIIIVATILATLLSLLAAAWLGWISGVYEGSKEASFQKRALTLLAANGQAQEFLILSGEEALVRELYRVVVATTTRVEEMQAAKPTTNANEGIALNDTEQDTNRSGSA